MSSEKGNAARSRPQKHQNRHAFKNDMHDTSHKTKMINNITVVNVCERCKKVIEWKIKYKKYKPLKAPAKCTKCEQKVIKHAYHIMCGHCALEHEACPKCGEKKEIVKEEVKEEAPKLDRELRLMLKKLPERKRRTFLRYMNRKTADKEKSKADVDPSNTEKKDEDDNSDSEADNEDQKEPLTRDDLLEKLKTLMISCKKDRDSDDFGSDSDDPNDENGADDDDDDD